MTEQIKRQHRLRIMILWLLITTPFVAAANMANALLQQRIWDALPMENTKMLWWGSVSIGYLILFWISGSLNTKNQVFFAKESACQLKEQVYSAYIRSKKFLYEQKSLSSTVNNDIPMLEEDFYYAIVHCLICGADALLAFIVAFLTDAAYGIFFFIVMMIPILLSMRRADRISDTRQKLLEEKEGYTRFLSEMGRGKETIRHYQLLEAVRKRHEDLVTQIAELGAKKREQLSANLISSQNINRLMTTIASLVGFYLVSRGELTLGWVMAFGQLSSSMTYSLVDAIQTGVNIYSCLSVRRKIENQYEPERNDHTSNQKTEENPNTTNGKIGCHCHIESCKLGDRQILNDIDFSLAPGEKLLITGGNGSGKTTLLKILLGLNEKFDGFVEWSDENGQIVKKEDISERIAYIPQIPFVFDGTVKENILLNAIEENDQYQEIKEKVCLKTEDDKSVQALHQTISGGEKQKIELARALYSGREVLILDEPYSALDQGSLLETEQYLLTDPTKTVIVVSHAEREETKKLYTNHLILENGKQESELRISA